MASLRNAEAWVNKNQPGSDERSTALWWVSVEKKNICRYTTRSKILTFKELKEKLKKDILDDKNKRINPCVSEKSI